MNEEFNLLGDAQFTEEEQQAFDGTATGSTPAIPQEVPETPEAVEEVTEPVEAPAEKAPTAPDPEPGNIFQEVVGSLGNALSAARGGEGSGGATNWADSLTGDLANSIDNAFGDNSTRAEINEKQEAGREKRSEERSSNPISATVDEATGIVQGSGVGALESTLGAAEVLGDTIKSIPSLVGITGEDGRQNPFSSQYEWAQWKLQSDDVAAKTPVGQIAQGFGEFAIIMGATGGFQSVAGAGSAFKAAGTLGGKAKVALSTGAKEGMYGLAADFIDGLAGNDNLSNLIKEHAPEWLPTWATALAVDDADGPYTNAIKNSLEGFGMGSMIGGVGAVIAGRRGLDALPANATRQEKLDAFVEASSKSVQETLTTDVPPGLKSTFNRLQDIGDDVHFQRLKPVMEQAEKGIPYTWDDMANVFPELFTPASRILPNDFSGAIYRAIDDLGPDGDFTRNPFTGAEPAEGFSVAIDGASLNKFDRESVQAFMQKHADVLSREDVFLGAWKAPDTGITEIELSRVVPDRGQAELLGTAFDQKGIYDNGAGRFIPTWGGDTLRTTQNGHLKGPMDAPSASKTTPTWEKAAVDALRPEPAGVFNGAKTATRSPLTKSAIKQLKKSMGGDIKAQNKKWLDSFIRSNRVSVEQLSKTLQESPQAVAKRAYERMSEMIDQPYAQMKGQIPTYVKEGEEFLTNDGVVTVNALMKGLSSELHKHLKSVGDLGRDGIDNTPHVLEMIDTLGALMKTHHFTASANARALMSEQIDASTLGAVFRQPAVKPPSPTKFEKAMENMEALAKAVEDGSPAARLKAQKLASMLQLADGNPAKMNGLWQSLMQAGEDVAFRSFFNSLLSAPTTHLVNTLSSATNTWLRPLAGAVGTGDFRQMRYATWNFQQNFAEAWHMGQMAWKSPDDVGQAAKKMQHGVGAEETKQTLSVIKDAAQSSGDKNLEYGVNMIEFMRGIVDSPLASLPSRMMTTTDEFMKAWTSRVEYNTQTFNKALEMGDDSGKALDETFQALLDKNRDLNFDPETGEILDPDLLRVAKEANFQQALEGQAAQLGQFVNQTPMARVFFPFVKTGHNIMVFNMQHTPIVARFTSEYKAVMKGSDEYAKAVMKGRERIGYGITGAAGMLFMSGNLTGAADPSATQRDLQARPPTSIRIGDKWFDYSRLTPFDFPLRMVASVGDAFQKGQLSEDKAGALMSHLAYSLSANLTQRSVTAGLQPLGVLLNPNLSSPEKIAATIGQIPNSFLPGSSARRAVNSAFRPWKMEFDNTFDRFLDQVTFGAMGNGAIKYDMLSGEVVKNLAAGRNTLNPINVSDRKTSPARDWLEDLQYDRDLVFKTMGGVDLKPEHRSAISRLMGEQGLEGKLNNFVKNNSWAEKDRARYIEVVQSGSTDGEDLKGTIAVQPFYQQTHEIIMQAKREAIESMRGNPEYQELFDEIDAATQGRKQEKFAAKGDNYLQQLSTTN